LDLQFPLDLLGLLSQSGQLRLPDLQLLLDLQLPLDPQGLLNQSDLLHLLSP
jgi:hypothetical protein